MPPKRQKPSCQVCTTQESKYTCSKCMAPYCSVACYKQHKDTCSAGATANNNAPSKIVEDAIGDPLVAPPESEKTESEPKPLSPPLRPLTSLKWPYIPEESAYEDPLKRDDPKPLQLHQYESIATSPAIREVIAANPRLRDILRSIDQLHGEDRQEALQRALGVSSADVRPPGIPGRAAAAEMLPIRDEEDIQALRRLAEAVEAAVRGGKHDVLGLDWGD